MQTLIRLLLISLSSISTVCLFESFVYCKTFLSEFYDEYPVFLVLLFLPILGPDHLRMNKKQEFQKLFTRLALVIHVDGDGLGWA